MPAHSPMSNRQPPISANALVPDQQPPMPAHAPMSSRQLSISANTLVPDQQPPVPAQQPPMPAHAPTPNRQPALDEVHAHIKNITGCIQELLKAAQSQRQIE